MRKFVDGLPGLVASGANYTSYNNGADSLYNADGTNLLGQALPLAVADTTTYPGTNYMYHRGGGIPLPDALGSGPRRPRFAAMSSWKRCRNSTTMPTASKHIALTYPNGDPILYPPDFYDTALAGTQVYAVDYPNYLGPIVTTTTGTPVRLMYANLLPTGHYSDRGALRRSVPAGGHHPDGGRRRSSGRRRALYREPDLRPSSRWRYPLDQRRYAEPVDGTLR